MQRRWFILIALCLLIAPRATDSAPAKPSRFGIVESYYRPDEAADLGVGWDRIIFEWRYLQPNSPADWDTSHIPDEWLQTAKAANREVVGLIKNAPNWATGSKLLGAPPLGLDKPITDSENTFAAFVTKLVRYYGTRWNIHHWIIYNEPDIRPEDTDQFEFAGDETDYYHVLKVAYKAAHAADPQAVIHLAGTTWWQDVQHNRPLYLERLLRVALKDPEARANKLFFDVMTVHVYSWTRIVWDMSYQLRSVMTALGVSKPIWIDETNARITADGDWKLPDAGIPISLEQQASFIVQASALALGLGADRIGVYRLYDDVPPGDAELWGLVRHDGTHRPAYEAMRTVIREMSATTNARRISKEGVTVVTLRQPGRSVTVLWNQTDKPIIIRTPSVDGAQLLSPMGASLNLTKNGRSNEFILPPCDGDCTVEGEPRLLKQNGAPPPIYLLTESGTVIRLD